MSLGALPKVSDNSRETFLPIWFSLRAKLHDIDGAERRFKRQYLDTLDNNEVEAMDVPVTDQQDGFSDYGSDFTPDEEEILNALLHQGPEQVQDDGPNRDPDLLLKGIGNEEGPRVAKVPRRHGQQSQEYTSLPLSETSIAIRLDSDNNRSANSTFCACWPS